MIITSLKKYLRRYKRGVKTGQVVVEYFVLLVVIMVFAIVGTSVFFYRTQATVSEFTDKAVNVIAP